MLAREFRGQYTKEVGSKSRQRLSSTRSAGQTEHTQVGTSGFCHDANGNLTADGQYVYLYDVENRLVEMRSAASTACPSWSSGYTGQLKAELRYDPLGRLHEVKNYTSGYLSDLRRFLYDGDALVAETNASGTVVARHIHGPAPGVDDPLVSYDGQWVPIEYARLLYADPRGSIVYRADSSGANAHINGYDEYGQPAATNVGRFGYTGQVWLDELGMSYYKARIYAPRIGRFLQTDPIGYKDGFNLYAYVGNNPINAVDPTGMYDCKGTEGECAAFEKTLGAAKSRTSIPKTGSRIIDSTTRRSLNSLGKNDGKGPAVTFEKEAGAALASWNQEGNTLNFDLNKIVKEGRKYSKKAGISKKSGIGWVFSGTIIHEARHRTDGTIYGSGAKGQYWSEVSGYEAERNFYLNNGMPIRWDVSVQVKALDSCMESAFRMGEDGLHNQGRLYEEGCRAASK